MLFCETTAYVHGRQCYYPGKFMHYHAVDRNIGFDIFMPWTCEYISDAMLISVILFKYLKVAVKKLHLLFLASSFFLRFFFYTTIMRRLLYKYKAGLCIKLLLFIWRQSTSVNFCDNLRQVINYFHCNTFCVWRCQDFSVMKINYSYSIGYRSMCSRSFF